jgi:glutamyl-tRNA reductase
VTAGLLALGVSHKTAPLELRERLSLPEGRAAGVLRELRNHTAVQEAVVISTCNRTELTLVVGDPVDAESAVLGLLAHRAQVRPTELMGHVYSLRDAEAVRHLFEVAAGLDSMIVGEAEVQGQVKRAYELALVEGVTGPVSNRLFRDALGTGKRVRTETEIGRSHVSVSSVAVELAQATLGDLKRRRVLIIGAGETGELTARALHAHGVETVFVANRRYDRALGMAERFDGTAVRFEELPVQLAESDIVVSSTGSPHTLIGHDEMEVVMELRGGRPLLLVDIAVPRDIEPRVREITGVTLYDMDDLQRQVARNLSVREAEATRARRLVEDEAQRYEAWLASLEIVPTISALRAKGEDIVQQVLAENDSRWETLSIADRERVALMARAIVSRLLHEPTVRLKTVTESDAGWGHLQALRELFGIDPIASAPDNGEATPADRGEVRSLADHRRRQRSG